MVALNGVFNVYSQWWMCNGISTMVFMLSGIFTYVFYSVSGGHTCSEQIR